MGPVVKSFADHFSGHAGAYSAARPSYPSELFDRLAELAPSRRRAWDVGCGNGQATVPLAERFGLVLGSEPSVGQLALAPRALRGRLVAAAAEAPILDRADCDLVVAAQAAHWFDMRRFAEAARAALRPGGVVALWCYPPLRLGGALDAVIDHLDQVVLGPWWPKGREHIDTAYASLDFPFDELEPPAIEMERLWDLDALMAYVDTWSGVRRMRRATGADPLPAVRAALAASWGESPVRRVRWPLGMRLGRVR